MPAGLVALALDGRVGHGGEGHDGHVGAWGGKGKARQSTARASRPHKCPKRGRLYRWRHHESSQRHRPSYTVSPAGQRRKRSPAVGAAQAVNGLQPQGALPALTG